MAISNIARMNSIIINRKSFTTPFYPAFFMLSIKIFFGILPTHSTHMILLHSHLN